MISLLPLNQQKIRFHHDEIKTVIHFTKTYVLKCLNIKFQAELQDSKKKEAWKRKPFIDKLIVYCFRLVINILITLLLGISLAAVYKVTEKMMEVCYRFLCPCCQSFTHGTCAAFDFIDLSKNTSSLALEAGASVFCGHIFPRDWLFYFL